MPLLERWKFEVFGELCNVASCSGRIVAGDDSMPFVLPILHNEAGAVFVDTVLFGADKVSVIFSFTRSYFMVDARIPSAYVLFLTRART